MNQVTNVQIAIEDRDYAEKLRGLLVADGNHEVHVLERPITAVDGVIVVDEKMARQAILSERYVVLLGSGAFQADELFEAGVRHVIHAGCAPQLGLLTVLAAERRLNQKQLDPAESAIFNEKDRLFLQAMKICDSTKTVLRKPVAAVQLGTRITETIPSGAEIEVSHNSPRGWVEISYQGSWFSVFRDDLRDACSDDVRHITWRQ